MKRILLSFLMIAMSTFAFAQQAVAVSKADFQAKEDQLNAAIAANKADVAHALMTDLNHKMTSELAYTKMQIAQAQTQADKDAGYARHRHQTTDYSHAINLASDNIITHGADIKAALDSFAATLQ